jgi:hypothetical protein
MAVFSRLARPSRLLAVIAAAWLASLSGCGGTAAQAAPQAGFEPISCSDSPSPCA